jgi:hypothetical protein
MTAKSPPYDRLPHSPKGWQAPAIVWQSSAAIDRALIWSRCNQHQSIDATAAAASLTATATPRNDTTTTTTSIMFKNGGGNLMLQSHWLW